MIFATNDGMIALSLIGILVLCGVCFAMGCMQGEKETQLEAINRTVAEWQTDEFGHPRFAWRDGMYRQNQELVAQCDRYQAELAQQHLKYEELAKQHDTAVHELAAARNTLVVLRQNDGTRGKEAT